MNREPDVLERGTHLECDHAFTDQRLGLRCDDVHSEKKIALRVADELDHAVRLVHRPCPAARDQREFPDADLVAGGFRLFFGEADRRDFGIGVDAVRNRDRIERRGFVAGDHFGGNDAFFHRFVSEQRCARDVADREHSRNLRATLRVDGEEAALVGCETGRGEVEFRGDGTAADGDERHLEFARFVFAAGELARDHGFHAGGGLLERRDLRGKRDLNALLLEDPAHRLGDLEVGSGQNLRQHFDHQHLRTETRVDGGKLEADDAATDDQQRLRNFVETHGVVGVDDRLAVARPGFDVDRRAAGRDHDRVLGFPRFASAVALLEADDFGRNERRFAVGELNVIRFEERLDAFDVRAHDVAGKFRNARPVDFGSRNGQTDLIRFADVTRDFADVKQRLGRDAAPVEADSADFVAVEADDAFAELS